MVGKGEGGEVVFARLYCKPRVLGVSLGLAGAEGDHVVERIYIAIDFVSTMLAWSHVISKRG